MNSDKAVFPAIEVESIATGNNVEKNEVAIYFESGDMCSTLIMTAKLATELVRGLNRSLTRLQERKQ